MTSYIPRSGGQKKKNILRQRELALRGDIRREASTEKLDRSADKVRLAQLGVIKALKHETQPARTEDVEESHGILQKLEDAAKYWTNISAQEIILVYSKDPEKTSVVDLKKW